MPSSPTIDEVRSSFHEELVRSSSGDDLKQIRDRYLGRKRGLVQALLKSVAHAPQETRRSLGEQANKLKSEIEQALTTRLEKLQNTATETVAADITLPGRPVRLGHRHPANGCDKPDDH